MEKRIGIKTYYLLGLLIVLLAITIAIILSSCKSDNETTDSHSVTVYLHDTLGPNTDTVVTLKLKEGSTITEKTPIANYYSCIGIFDANDILIYDTNEYRWNINIFESSFLDKYRNDNNQYAINLYVKWDPKEISLSFDNDIPTIQTNYDANISALPIPDLNNSDYTFGGWYNNEKMIANEYGEVVISGFNSTNCIIVDGTIQLAAKLIKRESTVIFDGSAHGINVSKTFEYGYVLSKEDYPTMDTFDHLEFIGWSESVLEFKPYTNPIHEPIVYLYAIWKRYSTLYIYDNDLLVESIHVFEGESLDLTSYNEPQKEGFEVEGFYNNVSFSGNAVKTYVYGFDMDVFVKWQKCYRIKFYEGSTLLGERNVHEGDKLDYYYYSLIEESEDTASHKLDGLYVTQDFVGVPIITYSADKGITELYAKRKDATYIYYHSNPPMEDNGEETIKSSFVENGEETKLLCTQYKYNGWTFAGWANNAQGSVIWKDCQIITDTSYAENNLLHLYAVWKVNPLEIGKYVKTKTIVRDTDGEFSYTVYNTIDSTPWSLADYAIIDWRNESNTNVSSHTNRVVNDQRYHNIDICTNTKKVYFIGDSNKTFANFQFHLQ